MKVEFKNCRKCGRLYVTQPGQRWCPDCTAEYADNIAKIDDAVYRLQLRDPGEIADRTGIPLPFVKETLNRWHLLDDSAPVRGLCAKCRKNTPQEGSDFCVNCRLELLHAFGSEADSLFASMDTFEHQPPGARNVSGLVAAMEEKRGLTSSDRLKKRLRRIR